jgi:hypothetical protein
MRESTFERATCASLEKLGAVCIKVGFDGWPDRLVLVGEGAHCWIEFKQERGRLRKNQVIRREDLEAIGDTVHVCKSQRDADEILATTISLLAVSLPRAGRAADGRAPADGGAAQDGPRKDRHHPDRSA